MTTYFHLVPINAAGYVLGVRRDDLLGLVNVKRDALVIQGRPVVANQRVKLTRKRSGAEIFFAPDQLGQLRVTDQGPAELLNVVLEAGNEGDIWRLAMTSASGIRKYLRHSDSTFRFDEPSGELFISDSSFRLISLNGDEARHREQSSRRVRTRQSSKIESMPTQARQTPANAGIQREFSRSSYKSRGNWTYHSPIQVGDVQVMEVGICKHAGVAVELTIGSVIIHEVDTGDAYERQTPFHIAVVLGFTKRHVIVSFLKDIVRVAENNVQIRDEILAQEFSGNVVQTEELYEVPCTTIAKKIERLGIYDAEKMRSVDQDQLPDYAFVFCIYQTVPGGILILSECEWEKSLQKLIQARDASIKKPKL
jgi:hypothetical protein